MVYHRREKKKESRAAVEIIRNHKLKNNTPEDDGKYLWRIEDKKKA